MVNILVDDVMQNPITLRNVGNWAKVDYNPGTSSVTVILPKQNLEVKFFYKRFAFSISMPSHFYSDKVEGLCGKETSY